MAQKIRESLLLGSILALSIFFVSTSFANEAGHQHGESSRDKATKGSQEEAGHHYEEDGSSGSHDDHAEEASHDDHAEGASGDDHAKGGSHDDHSEETEIRKGQAVREIKNEGKSFKLSLESEKFLKIKTSPVLAAKGRVFKVPKTSIVTFQNTTAVYVKKDGWFEIRKVKIIKLESEFAFIKAKRISAETFVVFKGIGFLRAAHLQASGQGGKGHAH